MNRSPTTLFIRPALLLALVAIGGCGSTRLETGYQPRPLGAGDAERKAFYSAKYTRAAALAEQERGREAEFRARRPDYRPGM
jgi:hypothetical protein